MSSLAYRPRTLLIAALAVLLIAAAAVTATESADGAKPKPKKPLKQVSLVSFVGGSTTALRLSWPRVKGATKYEIDVDDNIAMSSPSTIKLAATGAARMGYTLSGLSPGKTYCVQIRGKRGKRNYGPRSRRTCKPTVISRGPATGAPYRVMTYNVCSTACKGRATSWKTRSGLATSLIKSQAPDVLAIQEHSHGTTSPLLNSTLSSTYAATTYLSAKDLFYKRSRFSLARTGSLSLTHSRYAVWAELIDKAESNRHVIFVSAHLSSGKSAAADAARQSETSLLISGIEGINRNGLPVVYAGDFNSNKSRPTDGPRAVFNANGYYDAYDLAARLSRPNWNSAAAFSSAPAKPRKSYTWGDHVDHIWVRPGSSNVTGWSSPAVMKGKKYATPMPSDHKPVVVTVWIN